MVLELLQAGRQTDRQTDRQTQRLELVLRRYANVRENGFRKLTDTVLFKITHKSYR